MEQQHIRLGELLIDVEAQMRQLQLWQQETPAPEDLASTEPFAIDTLRFEQWLQFIFLPGLYRLLETNSALPSQCSTAPMAQEYFKGQGIRAPSLESLLLQIDTLLCSAA